MNRSVVSYYAVSVLAALCLLTGCQKGERFQTTFPLEEEAIASALEKAGLPGKISESETDSYSDRHTIYVVRSETETYADPNNGVMVASASSSATDYGRMLSTVFDRLNTEQFSWEDWKRQIIFATLLYGGFEEEDAVYKVFCEKELPDTPPYLWDDPFVWDARLPEGYCRISYHPRSHKEHDEEGFEIRKQSGFLHVNIYETYELYQKLRANQKQNSN